MELELKPYHSNTFPLAGILIKSPVLQHWLQQLQLLNVDLQQVPVYAIPGNTANTVWGCFVPLTEAQWKQRPLNANEPCQLLHNKLYIPQYATLYPLPGAAEIEKLFPAAAYIQHPEFGLLALDTPVVWRELLQLPVAAHPAITIPLVPAFVPQRIRRLEIKTLPPEEVINAMEQDMFPKKQSFTDKPLNWAEKIKMGLLRTLFRPGKPNEGGTGKDKTGLMKLLENIGSRIQPRSTKWVEHLQQDLEQLEKRNQTEMEKLMQLFKNNPDEALKYAIPLDESGTGRGGHLGRFEMSRRWNSFSLFGNSSSGASGPGTVFGMDAYQKLQQQYNDTAREMIRQQQYEKAAFVYMKLLKNYPAAAKTLEDGKLYAQAASIHLKYLQNKHKAAECYEKGQMISDAISLYKELNDNEKVGDLYTGQQKHKEAFEHYHIVADEHIAADRYVKAALLYRNKMNATAPAQGLLLKGWRTNKDAFNCLNNYFQNIKEPELLLQAIENVYAKDTDINNQAVFLTALKHEHKKDPLLANRTAEIAYEIVAELATANPEIVSELKNFNPDRSLGKDLLRYKAQRRYGK